MASAEKPSSSTRVLICIALNLEQFLFIFSSFFLWVGFGVEEVGKMWVLFGNSGVIGEDV